MIGFETVTAKEQAVPAEGNYFPCCILKEGTLKWYPDIKDTEKHNLIREAIHKGALA
jgi:hypothetical protein